MHRTPHPTDVMENRTFSDETNIENRILDFLDGENTPEQWVELQSLLESSPRALELYCLHVKSQQLLQDRAREKDVLPTSPIIAFEDILAKKRKQTITKSTAIVAVLLISLFSTLWIIKLQKPQPLLTYKASKGSKFYFNHTAKEVAQNTLALGSELHLTQGVLEFTFQSGVKSIIQAPALIELTARNKIHLSKGSAWFHVPQQAIGFQVKTNQLLVTDLGTKFGVLAGRNESDEVHVISGLVEVEMLQDISKETAKPLTLKEATACRMSTNGTLELTPIKKDIFLSQFPKDHEPIIILSDEFTHGFLQWDIRGTALPIQGAYLGSRCRINTDRESDHSDTFFNYLGKEIPATDQHFVALGALNQPPPNSISQEIFIKKDHQYIIYFRYAGHGLHQKIHAKCSLGDTILASTGALQCTDSQWKTAQFSFIAQHSGKATLTFDDRAISQQESFSADLLLDSVLVTEQAIPH